jgi:hypothetical protein
LISTDRLGSPTQPVGCANRCATELQKLAVVTGTRLQIIQLTDAIEPYWIDTVRDLEKEGATDRHDRDQSSQ